jgi:hypothetical protein
MGSFVTCNLAVTLSAAVVIDLNSVWLMTYSGPTAFLAADMGSSDTTITLTVAPVEPQPGLTVQQALQVGSSLLIGEEPVIVTAIAGAALTVTRYATAFPFILMLPTQPTTTHSTGESVWLLTYHDPWYMLSINALLPYAQKVVIGLGGNSATFGSSVVGTMTGA